MKKSGKKLLGSMLALSLAMASVFPLQGTAARQIGSETETSLQENLPPTETPLQKNLPSAETPLQENQPSAETPLQENQPPAETPLQQNAPSAERQSTAPQEDGKTALAASFDVDQPVFEHFTFEENRQTVSWNDTLHFQLSAYDSDSGIQSVSVSIYGSSIFPREVVLQHSGGNLYTGTLSCSALGASKSEYYISKILITDHAGNYTEVETFGENGYLYTFSIEKNLKVAVSDFRMQANPSHADGNLRVGDTVTYTANVICEGGEISVSTMNLRASANGGTHYKQKQMNYDPNTHTLTDTLEITEDMYPTEWTLSNVTVSVKNERTYSFSPDQLEPEKNVAFSVVQDNYDTVKPVIESISIDKQMVKAGDTVTITAKVTEEHPVPWVSAKLSSSAYGAYPFYIHMILNEDTMEYVGKIEITSNTYPTTWKLTELEMHDQNKNATSLSEFDPDWETACPWYFTVDPSGYSTDDPTPPVIQNITIDKNHQWVTPGESVTITVKVEQENSPYEARATFRPQVQNVSTFVNVDLVYHEDTMEYIGVFPITNITYPCEWMLTELKIRDAKGCSTTLSDFADSSEMYYSWYYRVKSKDTYREDVKDVTFQFYGLVPQNDGSYLFSYLTPGTTIENVGRRTSLKELGISLPKAPEGTSVTWRYGWQELEATEETELRFFDPQDITLTFNATYDKGCANVSLTYLTKNEGLKTIIIPQFADKNATYREILDSLPLPEDAWETTFSGFQLQSGYDESTRIGDLASFSAEALYNGCQVLWNAKYLNPEGTDTLQTIPAVYEKGTTVAEALAALEAPEPVNGFEFEGWVLTEAPSEDTLSLPITTLNVAALYRGKTTVDVSYTYRGADGILTRDSKLMLLNGEQLSDSEIQGAATGAFKEVTHLKGLILSEWAGSILQNQARYKKIEFQALYANCVVTLKYPDDTCQYVVVNKNAPYTLPTQNEKYAEILWEGYAKGETVLITEDREFLAAEAVFNDGGVEKPSGVTLSAEEIEQILAEIEHAKSGASIPVDMKKATVVPKEILEAIQGKEINILLNMDGYSWSIGGTEVNAAQLTDIDLEVKIDTDAIPSSLVDSIAEGQPATQISLTHNGEFGFRADLILNLGSENSGSTGNLYYYDSSGKLVFQNAGQVQEDGAISLSFSHASDYVIILATSGNGAENNTPNQDKDQNNGQNQGSGQNNGQNNTPAPDTNNGSQPADSREKNNNPNPPKSPKTGA